MLGFGNLSRNVSIWLFLLIVAFFNANTCFQKTTITLHRLPPSSASAAFTMGIQRYVLGSSIQLDLEDRESSGVTIVSEVSTQASNLLEETEHHGNSRINDSNTNDNRSNHATEKDFILDLVNFSGQLRVRRLDNSLTWTPFRAEHIVPENQPMPDTTIVNEQPRVSDAIDATNFENRVDLNDCNSESNAAGPRNNPGILKNRGDVTPLRSFTEVTNPFIETPTQQAMLINSVAPEQAQASASTTKPLHSSATTPVREASQRNQLQGKDLFRKIAQKVVRQLPSDDDDDDDYDSSQPYVYKPEDPNYHPRGIVLFRKIVKKVIRQNRSKRQNDTNWKASSVIGKMKGSWGTLLMLASVRKKVAGRIRDKRKLVRDDLDSHLGKPIEYPSRLHRMCNQMDVSLAELQEAMEENPAAVSKKDAYGRLPLHILGDNDHLVSSAIGRQTATAFAWTLMQSYPLAITQKDNRGCMPFVAIIEDWVQYTYEQHRKARKRVNPDITLRDRFKSAAYAAKNTTGSQLWSKALSSAGMDFTKYESTPSTQLRSEAFRRTVSKTYDENNNIDNVENISTNHSVPSIMQSDSRGSLADKSSFKDMESRRLSIHEYSMLAHPKVELWDEVEWCFEMLSLAMDELGGKNGGLYKQRQGALIHASVKDRSARTQLSIHISERIPAILKTILLMEEDGTDGRKRLLKMSIIRRLLLCHQTVGPWLLNMLRRKSGIASSRAVDYLELVSGTTVADYVGLYRTILPGDYNMYAEERGKVFDAINGLDGLVASLVVLQRRETERASATSVVLNVMNNNLRRPFVVGLVLIDFVLHITLMLAFKRDVSYQQFITADGIGNVPSSVIMFISSHYFIRKCCEALSLLKLSPQIAKNYFMNIWTIFDFMSIILVISAITWNDKNRDRYRNGLNTFVLGLLWIKVLGFLKVVNKEMSTFILSLLQILRELKYFLVVLMVIVFMFGDMFHIALSTKDDGEYCQINEGSLSDVEEDFCSPELFNSYIRTYSLLLGDFELSDYKETSGVVALFVIFTMIGVIILLNVLIAVIADSYERAKIQSTNLFGRARVSFVAQNEALESFLRPGSSPLLDIDFFRTNRKEIWVMMTRIFRYLVLFAIIATAMSAEVYLGGRVYQLIRQGKNASIMNLVIVCTLAAILTMSLFVVVNFACEALIRAHFPRFLVRAFDRGERFSRFCVNILAGRLFGLAEIKANGDLDISGENEWVGKLTYMERVFESSMEEMKREIKEEILAFEKRMYEHNIMAEQSRQEIMKTGRDEGDNAVRADTFARDLSATADVSEPDFSVHSTTSSL